MGYTNQLNGRRSILKTKSLSENYLNQSENQKINVDFIKSKFTEQKVGAVFFAVTFLILLTKVFFILQPSFHWKELVNTVFNDSTTGLPMMTFHWEEGIKGSYLLWPIFCGISVSIFTWIMVYLDSDIPGIHPPSPSISFSSSQERRSFSRQKSCHMGYIMAVASGAVVFLLVLYSNNRF